MKEDMRSKRFVFVPFCLMCQAFQARGIVKHGWRGVIKPIIEVLVKEDINIVQMPCPESNHGGFLKGLKREPKGINDYDNIEFNQLCNKLASETVGMMKAILLNGYKIEAILGIEYSPSCAVKYQYTNKGTIHRSGIFIENLRTILDQEGICIPFIGVNRRGIKKSVKELKEIFGVNKQENIEF